MAADMSWMLAALQPGGGGLCQPGAPAPQPPPRTSPIFLAASRGDAAALRRHLLEEEGDNEAAGSFTNGWLPVHAAAAKGHAECLRVLHEARYPGRGELLGALTEASAGRMNALHLAARAGHLACVQYICGAAAKDGTKGEEGKRGSSPGSPESGAGGHSAGAAAMALPDGRTGATALHLAAHGGHEEICRTLVKAAGGSGAAAAVANDEGMTPLLVAAASGQLCTFRFLLEVHLEGLGNKGSRSRAVASVTSGSNQTLLHKASAAGHFPVVLELLERFYKAPDDDEEEEADSEEACRLPGCAKDPLRDPSSGALLSGVARGFCSTVHAAAAAADEALYDFDSRGNSNNNDDDDDDDDDDGNSGGGVVRATRRKEKSGGRSGKAAAPPPDVDAATESGATALHLACQGGHEGVAAALLDKGADPGRATEAGQTPLHKACYEGHADVVELLLQSLILRGSSSSSSSSSSGGGEDSSSSDGDASGLGRWGVAAALRCKDREGHTVLHCAAAGGRHRVVELLFAAMEAVERVTDAPPTTATTTSDWPDEREWLYATLSNGEDAAILAAKNGFKDLASKITRRMYLDTRKRTLMRDFFE